MQRERERGKRKLMRPRNPSDKTFDATDGGRPPAGASARYQASRFSNARLLLGTLLAHLRY